MGHAIVALASNKGWSIVNISQLSPGAIKSVAKFTCCGMAEFKLIHYQEQDVLSTQRTGEDTRTPSW